MKSCESPVAVTWKMNWPTMTPRTGLLQAGCDGKKVMSYERNAP